MRKNLLLGLVCGICLLITYRFANIYPTNPGHLLLEQVHMAISKVMEPALSCYNIPKEQLLRQDVEGLIMPVMGELWQERMYAMEDGAVTGDGVIGLQGGIHGENCVSQNTCGQNGSDSENGDDDTNVPDGDTNVSADDTNMPDAGTDIPAGDDGAAGGNGTDGSGEGEDITTSAFPLTRNKQILIERSLLYSYDYLVKEFYQIDAGTRADGALLQGKTFLSQDMTLKENVKGPQVLIYHTHSLEGYKDSKDGNSSVVAVGEKLAKLLQDTYGIQVLHHKESFDAQDHATSYSRALPALKKILKENPTIEVVIDLHRDGVPEGTHLVTEIDGKSMAQIMFFNGISRSASKGELTYLKNPYLEDNLAFSLQMQVAAEEYFPGLARKIYLKTYRYNMHLCPKTLLVEVGAQTNSYEEASNSMDPLAFLLAKVLKTDKVP